MAVNLIINGINPANNIHDNSVVSLADSVDPPGILIWNRSGFRQTNLLTILSTMSNNQDTSRQSYGVKIDKCPDSGCTSNTFTDITITNDTLAPNRLGSYCGVNGIMFVNPNIGR